ncbi:unnamed protein product [Urochloa decumbens]|uniref:Serpin domain-containing protein n=1 Tax=Urochloa decumbens TaxID=240449 RepID=A0ABC8WDE0_9POAL
MEEEASPRLSKKARGVAGSGLTDFALRLAKRLTDGAAGDGGLNHNLVFSPVSIYAALSLVAAGARGTTLDELLALLGAASRDELAESARGVSERALTDRSGSASGAPLPEKERERINHWVSEATDDLITSILPPGSVHSLTGLVIANAIYFKGRWSMPFNERDTETRQFHRLDGSTVDAPFMCSRRDQAIAVHEGFKVLKLAYHPYRVPHWEDKYRHRNKQQDSDDDSEQPRFSMCVFLPDAWDGLSELINDVLRSMGMEAAFDMGKADLTDMLEGDQPLVVEHVFHKAVIEVDEEGTKAAASTACSIKLKSYTFPVDFVADHPFAFFVVEEVSGTVVFMGNVIDPTRSE